jgi:hypothetical protein
MLLNCSFTLNTSSFLGPDVFLTTLFSNSFTFSSSLGRAVAQAVSRRPLTAAAWFRAQVNPVGFVVDKVALGQVFLQVLRFSPVNIILPWAPHFRKFKK